MEDACYRCATDCPGDIYCKPYGYKYYKRYENDVLNHETLINKEKKIMITVGYLEHFSQSGIEKLVFYSYKEFFQFWSHHSNQGIIKLFGCSEMEDN